MLGRIDRSSIGENSHRPWLTTTAAFGMTLLAACSGEEPAAPQASAPPSQPPAAESAVSLDAAMTELGMANLDTLSYGGTAWRIRNSFRQTLTASPPWPERDEITNYQRTIDLNAPASRATGDTFASNLFLEPPVAGTYTQDVRADQNWAQQLEIWTTPWGFLKGAEQYGAELSGAQDGMTVFTWQTPIALAAPSGLSYTVNGYIDENNRVRRVETWVEDPFMGDLHVVGVYDDWQEIDGVLMPATIEQQRAGGGVFGVSVTSAQVNPPNAEQALTAPPANTAAPGGGGGAPQQTAPQPIELAREVTEGVHLIEGGYVAMVVEFADHVAVFEAGQSEARGEQILAATQALHPDKEIRYLINSHPHADHTAGMVPFVREGVTIVTHENNIEFLDMALSTPRTLLGEDTLDPQFMPAGDVTVLEDDTRRLELHHIPNLHTDGMVVGYLPNERILFQADFTLPQPGREANPFVVELARYVDANGLDFDQYLAVHAAQQPQTRDELLQAIAE